MYMLNLWIFVLGCYVKKEDPELLIPPSDYDVEDFDGKGFQLCIETYPEDASVQVSSRTITECVRVQGEVFVEVSASDFISYRELMNVQSDLTHQVLLVPILPEPTLPPLNIPSSNIPEVDYPMPKQQTTPHSFKVPSTSVELCVSTIPESAYLKINGIKQTAGACMLVQNAAEVSVEAEGYFQHKELLSIPPNQSSPFDYKVVLEVNPDYVPSASGL